MPGVTKKRLVFWIWTVLALMVCAAIFLFSSQNGSLSGNVSEGVTKKLFPEAFSSETLFILEKLVRKAAHYGIYFILGVCVYFALLYFDKGYLQGKMNTVIAGLLSVGICFAYSLTDELHQSLVPGRNGVFSDCLLDTLGSFSAIALILVLSKLYRLIFKK